MSCSGHACDCLKPIATAAGDEVVEVWSKREHVSARLAQECGAPVVRWSAPQWPARLRALLAALTSSGACTVRVRFPDGDVIDAAVALERGSTPWLPRLLDGVAVHMAFQPLVDLRTGATHGRQALVRGNADGRELSGSDIVEAALAHDALAQMDVRARTLAIETAARSLPDGEALFVNFNPTTISDPEACLRTSWAVARRVGIPLARICFEVVETERDGNLEVLERILDRYREEGALIALDDLGPDHASLEYLQRLRPDVVKLDRSLTGTTGDDVPRPRAPLRSSAGGRSTPPGPSAAP